MNILIVVLLVALVALWWLSKSSTANLKVPMIALAVLAVAAGLFMILGRGNGRALPSDLEKIERDAGFTLGSEMKNLPAGPVLVLAWSGGGYNPDPARLQGIKKAVGNDRRFIMGGAYVEGMEVDDDFIKLDPLNPDAELRAYLEQNKELAAVVVLRPIRSWEALKGLRSPPFYIFTNAGDWERANKELVKAAMVGGARGRNVRGTPSAGNFEQTEYRLMTGS